MWCNSPSNAHSHCQFIRTQLFPFWTISPHAEPPTYMVSHPHSSQSEGSCTRCHVHLPYQLNNFLNQKSKYNPPNAENPAVQAILLTMWNVILLPQPKKIRKWHQKCKNNTTCTTCIHTISFPRAKHSTWTPALRFHNKAQANSCNKSLCARNMLLSPKHHGDVPIAR